MTAPAVQVMSRRMTVPFQRGADILALSLIPAGTARALVDSYDFAEHSARFGQPPEPRYVLTALDDIASDTTLDIAFVPANESPARLIVLAGSVAGSSFAIPTPIVTPHLVRLLDLRMDPPPARGTAATLWRIDALLGNLAKILWVMGGEKSMLRRHAERVQAQRLPSSALGPGLDHLGVDLAVPRFPPLPYGFDPAASTVALYHLDDLPAPGAADVATVEDAMRRYGGADHPGENVGLRAASRAVGRFGSAAARLVPTEAPTPLAFDFRVPDAEIRIADHADFAFASADSFTVECFVRPVPDGAGVLLSKHADPGNPALPGWVLRVGEFGRGIPNNPSFLVSDGPTAIQIFADVALVSEQFAHLAGVVDRAAGEARLYVDGVPLRTVSLASLDPSLGDVVNGEPVRIGHTTGGPDPHRPGSQSGDTYPGVIDEVRVSRAALSTFSPVLGEADDPYRRRLRLFARWTLPTAAELQRLLNDSVGAIAGVPDPLVVNDLDSVVLAASHPVTVELDKLPAGASIAADGNRRVREADVCGVPEEDADFEPDLMISWADGPGITFAAPPPRELIRGELSPAPNTMQLVVDRQLRRLLERLQAAGAGGTLHVESAFDPRQTDLRSVGRGLLMRHTAVDHQRLAAFAHNAGFAFVTHQTQPPGVYASMPAGQQLAIQISGGTATGAHGVDARLGETLVLTVDPPPPPGFRIRWRTVACGRGAARLDGSAVGPSVTLTATAPGALLVMAEATRHQRAAAGALPLRLGLLELEDGGVIAADGARQGEPESGDGDAPFHPVYLVTRDDDLAVYGPAANDRRMQPGVSARLGRLIELAEGTGAGGDLEVMSAYLPGDPGPAGTGRALRLRHTALNAARLGALAHAAGFSVVRREVEVIHAVQQPDGLIEIAGPNAVEIQQDPPLVLPAAPQAITLTAAPRATPRGLAASPSGDLLYAVNHGTDSVSEIQRDTGAITRAFTAGRGPVAAVVSPDGTRLYTADAEGQTVTAIDLGSGDQLGAVPLNRVPIALAHHPAQDRLYVACLDGDALAQIDASTLTANVAFPLAGHPVAVAMRPDGAEIWIAREGAAIDIVSTATMALLDTIPLSADPGGIAMLPDGTTAYVSLPASGELALLDVPSRTVTATVPAGEMPGAVGISPAGTAVYVLVRPLNRDALVVCDPDGTQRASVRVRAQPSGLAAFADHAYVANAGSDDISVIAVESDRAESVATWALGSGLGERLSWVIRSAGPASAQLNSTTTPDVTVTGDAAGPVVARVVYAQAGQVAPYTFDVRLRPELEATDAVIRKDQYDLIMNVLNAFHPIGVEVATRAIRERVIEVREALLEAFPDYTYPRFRVRHVIPPPRRKE